MTGAVLGFQLLIFLSILFTRVLAKDKLELVCGAWTLFTLMMVFASPLIVLQLVVVWGSYALLSPDEKAAPPAPFKATPKPAPSPPAPRPPARPAASPPPSVAPRLPVTEQPNAARPSWSELSWAETLAAGAKHLERRAHSLNDAAAGKAAGGSLATAAPPAVPAIRDNGGQGRGDIIKNRITRRGVSALVHFTRVENLPSIMRHGLKPVAAMQAERIAFRWNEEHRLDGHEDAISLSIGHPNEKLFFRWRMANSEQRWVVLLLDVAVLWTQDAAFCPLNAAHHRMVRHDRQALGAAESLDAMFAEAVGQGVRAAQCLLPSDPTDVQAEVLVFDSIAPSCITGAVFSDFSSLSRWRSVLDGRGARVVADQTGLFGLRSVARQSGKG